MPFRKTKTPTVNNGQYLDNHDEPVETISEMSPVQVNMTAEIATEMTKQRIGLRNIAKRLRVIKFKNKK